METKIRQYIAKNEWKEYFTVQELLVYLYPPDYLEILGTYREVEAKRREIGWVLKRMGFKKGEKKGKTVWLQN